MAAPKALTLTLIIPAYNEEKQLPACLESIADQTIAPDEVIVVDNNSTDRTADLAKKYPFVNLLREKRHGVVFARDTGFNAARGRLIGRIDADTVLPVDWVERVLKFYGVPANQSRVLTGGAYFYNARFGQAMGWWQGQIAFRLNRLLLGHYIFFGSNAVLPRKLWQAVKPEVCHETDVHEDLDLAIHLHRLGYQIDYHENLKVGVKMRRVFEDHDELWGNMMLWPKTLQRHGLWTWVFGWLGAVILYGLSFASRPFRK